MPKNSISRHFFFFLFAKVADVYVSLAMPINLFRYRLRSLEALTVAFTKQLKLLQKTRLISVNIVDNVCFFWRIVKMCLKERQKLNSKSTLKSIDTFNTYDLLYIFCVKRSWVCPKGAFYIGSVATPRPRGQRSCALGWAGGHVGPPVPCGTQMID